MRPILARTGACAATTAAPLILVVLLSFVLPAYAARTDVVILQNGDNITGEIKNLSYGKVEYKTDDMDRIYIEWEKIHHLTSVHRFETVDTDGVKRFGSIGRTEIPYEIVVIMPTATDTLPLLSIVRITPIKSRFIERLKGDISAGFSYTRATKTAEFTLGGKTDYRGDRYRSNLNYSAYITDQADKKTSRYDVGFSIDRFLRRRWTAGGAVQVEHNEELGLDLRTSITASGSRFVMETNKTTVDFSVGIGGTRETYIGSDSASYNLELPISVNYARFTFHNPKSDIRFSGSLYPNLTTSGRYRASLNLDFNYEVLKDFFVVIGSYYDYDNDPPSGAAKDDYRFSTSLKWSFG
ncbi:DUF481 domain-containing protein [Candidatus Eisenbacteria bacterium]|uniref:DUF481 domain-containing protein n=1 Tax=Eiseniibacteriota bacterium TaxID=2212470 RepID=A0ABV6YQ37_UNCEI